MVMQSGLVFSKCLYFKGVSQRLGDVLTVKGGRKHVRIHSMSRICGKACGKLKIALGSQAKALIGLRFFNGIRPRRTLVLGAIQRDANEGDSPPSKASTPWGGGDALATGAIFWYAMLHIPVASRRLDTVDDGYIEPLHLY